MNSSTAVFSSVNEVEEATWNDIVGADPAAQHGSLRAFESGNASGTEAIYFALRGKECPAAIAIGQLAADEEHFQQLTQPLLGRAIALAPAVIRIIGPTLILGLRPGYGAPIHADARQGQATQESLIDELCAAIEAYVDEQGLTLAVVGIKAWDRVLNSVLRRRGYHETQVYPTADFQVYWTSWDDYLMHFKSKRRQIIRRESNVFVAAGCRMRCLIASETTPRELNALFQEHYRRRNRRPAPYNESFINALRENLAGNSRIYVAELNNEILGFMAVLLKDDVAAASIIGIGQKARAQNLLAYFNFIYQLVKDAPALGLSRIQLGGTVYEAKRLRGCEITRTGLFLRPAGGVTRVLSGPVIAMHRRWYERKFEHLDRKNAPLASSAAGIGE